MSEASGAVSGEQRLARLQSNPESRGTAEQFRLILDLAEAVRTKGGRALLVGGCVRDDLLERTAHDFDLEVYGIDADDLAALVQKYGLVSEVGRAFGVLKLHHRAGDIDIALPRRDSKSGTGHRGFFVRTKQDLGFADAARRRDFTINAILQDPISGEIIDPFNGQRDLQQKILRVVDPATFGDDPLRALRAFQFIARFDLTPDLKTVTILRDMIPRLRELPPERFCPEWEKLLLSPQPSRGLQAAFDVGYFHQWFPDMAKMAETPQDPEHHPEGDAWRHTLLAMDRAREVIDRQPELGDQDRLVVMLATLTHDLGKVTATGLVNNRYRSLGHEEAGVGPAQGFIRETGFPIDVAKQVIPLVREHLRPTVQFQAALAGTELTAGGFRKLIRRLHPATLPQLLAVAEADYLARGPYRAEDGALYWPATYPARAWWTEQAGRMNVDKQMEPLLWGHDLVERGWSPGPQFGRLLKMAEELAQEGGDRATMLEMLDRAPTIEAALAEFESRLPK